MIWVHTNTHTKIGYYKSIWLSDEIDLNHNLIYKI
jgi:hypothetical protein